MEGHASAAGGAADGEDLGHEPGDEPSAPKKRRRIFDRVPRGVRWGVAALVTAFVFEYLALPPLVGASKSLSLIGRVNVGMLLLGIAAEAGALVAYALLTTSVLPRSGPGLFTLLRINMSTMAVSHVLPGGTAGGTGLGYRLLTQSGVRGTDAGFAIATQGIGSAVVLNGIFWTALVISIPFHPFNPLYAIAAVVGAFLLGAFAGLVLLLTKGQEHAALLVARLARKVPFLDEEQLVGLVRRIAARVHTLAEDRELLVRSIIWAGTNWLLDAASLWIFCAAFGKWFSPVDVLVAYGLANVLAAIPITPGGLGVVEGVLIPTLSGFGAAKQVVVLAVVTYRLFNFWLPIPTGGVAWASLQVKFGMPRRRALREIGHMGDAPGAHT